ncbi:hypothetical protein [Leifsonia sp. Root4]|uniref:hypothetical protein n=1 Tax=Leifsonia sp. Root4 TaxID=1736525 RepID=UPI000B00DDDE|nr:hypothetical protein [Leifsonia sp. Root4]
MFLSAQHRLHRSAEHGSALMAVIAVLGVTVIITMALGAITINALSATAATRAAVQSVAAAESGIDAVAVRIQTTPWVAGGIYTSASTDALSYTAIVKWSASADPAATESSWKTTAPDSTARLVRITSTGQAADSGVAGNAIGDVRTVEAIYSMTVNPPGVEADGAAVYAYSSGNFTGSGTLTSGTGTVPSVQIRKGDIACSGASPTYANVIVADGSFDSSGSCSVNGNVWASVDVTTSGTGSIGGSAIAGRNASVKGRIGGSVWGPTSVFLGNGAQVAENVATNGTLTFKGGNVQKVAWSANATDIAQGGMNVDGKLITKTLTGSPATFAGGVLKGSNWYNPGFVAPTIPFVPDWIEFDGNPSRWTGFSVTTLTGTCNAIDGASNSTAISRAIAALGAQPGVIDARGCTEPAVNLGGTVKATLTSNVAIIAKSFALSNGTFASASTRKLWLVVPDPNPGDAAPTCPNTGTVSSPIYKGNIALTGGLTLEPTVSAILYSPCQVRIGSGIQWQGQVFGWQTVIDGAAKLTYMPVGLPGVNLATGEVSTVPSVYPTFASPLSIRDVG